MKCNSCKADVPAHFTAAINANKCPACGGKIADGTLQKQIKFVLKQLSGQPSLNNISSEDLKKIVTVVMSSFNLVAKEDVNLDEVETEEVTKVVQANSKPNLKRGASALKRQEIEIEEEEDGEEYLADLDFVNSIKNSEKQNIAKLFNLNVPEDNLEMSIEDVLRPSDDILFSQEDLALAAKAETFNQSLGKKGKNKGKPLSAYTGKRLELDEVTDGAFRRLEK